jgi:hypothetical protein
MTKAGDGLAPVASDRSGRAERCRPSLGIQTGSAARHERGAAI